MKCPLRSGPKSFRWPENDDIVWYEAKHVLGKIEPPLPDGTFARMTPQLVFDKNTTIYIEELFDNYCVQYPDDMNEK